MSSIRNYNASAEASSTAANVNIPPQSLTETPAKTGTTKVIPIRKPLNLPPVGINNGIFIDVNVLPEDLGPDKKPRQLLKLDVQLEALDVHGKPFVVSKLYNLLARGLKVLNQDLRDWCGQDLIAGYDEQFDAGVFLGQPVQVTINNRAQGKLWFTTISSFHPAAEDSQPTQNVA
jgi:hypothetical protein